MLNILLCVVLFLFIFAGFKFTGAIMSVLSAIALFIFTPWFTIPLIALIVISIIAYREIA